MEEGKVDININGFFNSFLEEIKNARKTLFYWHNECKSFELISNKDGIKVETLKLPNSPLKVAVFRASTIIPSSCKQCLESFLFLRKNWDSYYHPASYSLFSQDKFEINGEKILEPCMVCRSCTKAAVGGLISPREFIDIIQYHIGESSNDFCWVASTGITEKLDFLIDKYVNNPISTHPDYDSINFVRGLNGICGSFYEYVESSSSNSACRFTAYFQTTLGGWIPQSLADTGLISTIDSILKTLNEYVLAH